MRKSTVKILFIVACVLILAFFIIGIVQSVALNNLQNRQNQLQKELTQLEQNFDYVEQNDYKDAYVREEKYGNTGEKIFETR